MLKRQQDMGGVGGKDVVKLAGLINNLANWLSHVTLWCIINAACELATAVAAARGAAGGATAASVINDLEVNFEHS